MRKPALATALVAAATIAVSSAQVNAAFIGALGPAVVVSSGSAQSFSIPITFTSTDVATYNVTGVDVSADFATSLPTPSPTIAAGIISANGISVTNNASNPFSSFAFALDTDTFNFTGSSPIGTGRTFTALTPITGTLNFTLAANAPAAVYNVTIASSTLTTDEGNGPELTPQFSAGTTVTVVVPEPATIGGLALASAAGLVRRRRQTA